MHVNAKDDLVKKAMELKTFLDDVTLDQLHQDLGVPVIPGGTNLAQLLDHLEAAQRAAGFTGQDLSKLFHADGLNTPQGAYNP